MNELRVLHVPTRAAAGHLIKFCIHHGDDPEFIELMDRLDGIEVFSRGPLWRVLDQITRDGANEVLFPAGCRDAEVFMATFEHNGFTEARRWLSRRLKISHVQPVSGVRREGMTQRVLYLPVESQLERGRLKAPKNRNRQSARLMER